MGLSIGLACFILILFYVYNETNFDKHQNHAKYIYRLGLEGIMGGNEFQSAVTGAPLGRIAMDEIPEVIILITRVIIIANIIAWPLAYNFSNDWLQNFSYRTDIKWWIFPLAGIFSLMLSSIIVGIKSYQSANKNPIDALKYKS